jgi:hypothetical protein
MSDLSGDKNESKNLLTQLIGKRLTDAFYVGNEIVLEFDGSYRLQVSPEGCDIQVREDAPPLG